MSKIWVTAAKDRIAPIDPAIATAPGAQMLFLKPGEKLEVDATDSRIVRQMRSGDLVETTAPLGTSAIHEIEGGGAPAVFGDAAPIDPAAPTKPHIAEPKES